MEELQKLLEELQINNEKLAIAVAMFIAKNQNTDGYQEEKAELKSNYELDPLIETREKAPYIETIKSFQQYYLSLNKGDNKAFLNFWADKILGGKDGWSIRNQLLRLIRAFALAKLNDDQFKKGIENLFEKLEEDNDRILNEAINEVGGRIPEISSIDPDFEDFDEFIRLKKAHQDENYWLYFCEAIRVSKTTEEKAKLVMSFEEDKLNYIYEAEEFYFGLDEIQQQKYEVIKSLDEDVQEAWVNNNCEFIPWYYRGLLDECTPDQRIRLCLKELPGLIPRTDAYLSDPEFIRRQIYREAGLAFPGEIDSKDLSGSEQDQLPPPTVPTSPFDGQKSNLDEYLDKMERNTGAPPTL